MNISSLKNKKWFWYTAYIILLTVFFLYILFPSGLFTDFIKLEAEKNIPGINVEIDKIRPSVMFGINISGLKISSDENPETAIFNSEKTSISFSVIDLLKGRIKCRFKSAVKGGRISGFFSKKDKDNIDALIEFKNINLDDKAFIHPVLNQRIEGALKGKVLFSGDPGNPVKGNTELFMELTRGRFKFKKTFFGINDIDVRGLDFSGEISNRKFLIKKLDLTGALMNGTASGSIDLAEDLLASRLNLKAEIEPSSALQHDNPDAGKALQLIENKKKDGKFFLIIGGTIDKPLPKFK